MGQLLDYYGNPVPLLGVVSTQQITTSGTSQQSAALTTRAVRIVCTEDCFFRLGENPTADNSGTSVFLPANVVETVALDAVNYKIAVVWGTDLAAGAFNITTLRV